MNQTVQKSKNPVRSMMISFFLLHAFAACQFGYLSLFFEDNGMTRDQIGILFGVAPLVAVLGQYTWSNLADKVGSVNKIFLLVILCATVTIPLYLVTNSFVVLLIIVCVYNFFFTSAYPLYDTICIYYSKDNNIPFGRLRLMGSLGYLTIMLLLGFAITYYIGIMFIVQIALGIILMLAFRMVPKVTMPKMKKVVFNPMTILRIPFVSMIIFVSFIALLTSGLNQTFFSPYFVNDLGAPSYFIGLSAAASIAVEVVFLINLDRLMKKFNLKVLFLILGIAITSRWVVYGLTTNHILLVAFAGFDGVGSIAMPYFTAFYLKAISPEEGRVTIQMIATIIIVGFSRGIGSLIGAPLFGLLGGVQNTYMFLAILMICVTVLFFIIPAKYKDIRAE